MSPLSKRRLKLWIRMLGVTRTTEARLRDYLRREHNTTLPRFDVLAALWRNRDGLTMGELSRMLLISNGNATDVVSRLEAEGLLTHPHTSAGRVPTDAGYRYYVDALMAEETGSTGPSFRAPEGVVNVNAGDTVVTEIEGIGRLVNTIVAAEEQER